MVPEPVALSYRGGLLGAFAPLLLFLAGVAWLGLSGAPGEQGLWPVLMAAIALGLILSRDRHAYSEAVIEGMSQPIVMVMVLAWLLAGMLAALLNATGFVEALVWLAHSADIGSTGFIVAAFLIACAVSTSTGTSLGTLILCSPFLYPAGGALGADPALLLGAILGGATFGDNLSPVSDTTIASTVTQGARMGDVVRSRLRYALPAAALALLAYTTASTWLTSDAPAIAVPTVADAAVDAPTDDLDEEFESTDAAPDDPTVVLGSSPRGLPMVLAPILVIFLLFRHVHLLEGLIYGVLTAAGLGLGLDLIELSDLIRVGDPAAQDYKAAGCLVDGMERGIGVSVFTILLMGLVTGLQASGVIARMLEYAASHIRGQRGAEVWSFGTVAAATVLTTHSVIALLAVGPFARETGFRYRIPANRRANILDTTVCTFPFILPYCIPTILAASTTTAGPTYGMPQLTALTAGLYNFHSWALLLVVLVAIFTGWGRGEMPEDAGSTREPESPWAESDESSGSAFFDQTEKIEPEDVPSPIDPSGSASNVFR
ncbi:MAG: Na+/H+ antiporter NhaC family protein [Acidobacteriota bacterium]